ncbi:BamA/TamA family outer membrane protein [Persephonella atlantica]|uniref:BamA/TamA family outer membrane protein n=1 Tax=Persephonella atlantica TaxID=2699429 RepID=A0ABS1GIY9_9AQUI|nr:POTRA domain-containing protein [Persephonella atlantica]MBK3332846.1 BamA/TamA family outer membrane protein [Persephonella atlantica]
MARIFLIFSFIFSAFYSAEGLEIITNYSLPKNNIQEVYQKTGNINLIVNLLKETGDFEEIYHKDGKLYLKRKMRVKKVFIKGNKSFWDREILAITGLLEGYPVDLRTIHNVYIRLKKFYMDNGFPFADITVESDIDKNGYVTVYLTIEEGKKAEIGNVLLYTSRKIPEKFKEEIRNISGIKRGELFRLSKITESIDRIQQFLYRKNYFDSFVNIVSFRPSKGRVDIILYVDLGMGYYIHIYGNKSFSKEKIIPLLTFKENGFNYYQLVQSTERIENFYRNKGFLDVSVIPSFEENYKKMRTDIYINIYEGDRYRVGKVSVETDFPEIRKILKQYEGKFLNRERIKKVLKRLSDRLFREGYLNTRYSIDEKVKKIKKTVDLRISFFRNRQFILSSVNITGYNFTYEEKLPRIYSPSEIISLLGRLKKKLKDDGYLDGDAFLEAQFKNLNGKTAVSINIKAKKGVRYKNGATLLYGTEHLNPVMIQKNLTTDPYYSKEDFDNELDFLYYTSLFDSINPVLKVDREKKKVNKLYALHEDKRGSFQGILGYNSQQKMKISAALTLKNLLSYGFELSGYIEKTDLGFFYKVSGGNRLLPKRTGIFISYLRSYQYHSIYDLEAYGTEVEVSRKPNRWIKQSLKLSYMNNSLRNQNFFPITEFKTLKLSFSVIDNHRKPEVNPSSGYILTGMVEREFSDVDFYKIYLTGRYYYSFLFFIFTQKLSTGYIFKKIDRLPPSERFFLGGVSSFRGFGYEKVAGENKKGGNTLLLLSSELRYPLFPRFNLYGFSFVDIGNVYESFSQMKNLKTRKSAGTGVYVPTPVGSFLFDVAFKLDRKPGESPYRLEFSINALF